MVDLSNLFTQITAPFNANSSIKVPETSFAASKENLTFANYRNLNNDDDKYVNDEQQKKKMQELLDKTRNDNEANGADKEKIASELYGGLKKLKDPTDTKDSGYAINSKEFLQNFNALTNQIKDDPTLINELRKTLVTEFGKLTDEQRKLVPDARKEWYEISYENSLDKLKAQGSNISSELENLSKLDPKKAGDKKEINDFIDKVKEDFGDVAKFNELLRDAGIKYEIDDSHKEGYSVKTTDPNSKTSAVDPKSTKAIQKGILDTWEKNAEFIQSLDTSKFKTDAGKKEAQEKITELAQDTKGSEVTGTKTYSTEDIKELQENLDFLTKAYKYNLDTGEFSKAELDRARMNLIGKVHEADKPAIAEYREKHTGKTDKGKPHHYESEFSDGISKLNTIAFLQDKGLHKDVVIPRLKSAAEANGYSDIKSATGDEDSALSELIEKSRNWKSKEPEAAEKVSNIKLNELSSGTYDKNNKTISFSNKDDESASASIGLGNFLKSLLANEIKLTDDKDNVINIKDAKDKVTLTKDKENKEVKVEIDNDGGQKIIFGIPLDELTDEFVKNYTTYGSVDELIASLKNK
jgi:hypothetical protein